MIGWYEISSYSITNGIRVFVCLFIVATLQKQDRPAKSTIWLSLICGAFTTLLRALSVPQIGVIAIEALTILFILCRRQRYSHSVRHTIEKFQSSRTHANERFQSSCTHAIEKFQSSRTTEQIQVTKMHSQTPVPGPSLAEIRLCAFLIIFFEIAVALWDFLFSTGFEYTLQNSTLDGIVNRYMIGIWTVRLLMVGLIAPLSARREQAGKMLNRLSSITAVAGLLFVLILTEQSVVSVPDDLLTTWAILSVILLMAVLFYRANRQYEMEKEIVRLKTEQAELLERDYQALRDIYAANAKLFHDFHNHIDVLHRYLWKGSIPEAIDYLEDLRAPIQLMTQTVRTGDEAVDHLINTKIALAESRDIRIKTNIEFPRHTDIRSVDLVAILGNLWDNSLEAVEDTEGNLRFINLTIRRINDMLIIKMENGCSKAPAFADRKPLTRKEDKTLHGWGLKSACTAADRYNGTVETEYDNNTFRTVVTLSFQSTSQKSHL